MRRRVLCVFASALALLLLAPAGAAEADKVPLRLQPPKGARYEATVTTEVQIVQTLTPGQKMTRSDAMTARCLYEVEDANAEGVVRLRITFTGMKHRRENNGSVLSGDSATREGKSSLDVVCRAVVGKSFALDMQSNGVFKNVVGGKEFVDALVAAAAKENPPQRAEIERQIRLYFTETRLAQFSSVFRIYPETGAAAIGETWQIKNTVPEYALSIDTTYKLLSADAKIATISAEGVLPPGDPITQNIKGLTLKMTMGGKQKSTLVIDLATGLPTSTSTDQRFDGTVEATTADSKTNDRWPLTLKSKMTATIREASEAPATASQPSTQPPR